MLNTPIAPENWRYVTSLPKLTSLVLNPELTRLASHGIRMAKLRTVSLVVEDGPSTDLRDAVTVFPEMTALRVYYAQELDVAPLAAHSRLSRVSTFTARLLNADRLPAHIRLNGVED